MDPLSVAASVTGLILAGGQIASLIQRLYDAPTIALAVEAETSHFVVVLSQLQPFLTGQRNTIAHPSRTSLVEVQQIQIILTGSVLTLSELQAAVGAICHGSTVISLRDRMKWLMAESNITQLIQRVRDHKSSLTLLLTLLTWYDRVSAPLTPDADIPGSKSTSEATNNMTKLCALLEQFIQQNTQLFTRVQELEGQSLAPEPGPSAEPGIRTSGSSHPAFERVLSESDLYRRVLNRGNQGARSGHALLDNRSIASGLSLSQVPNISAMRLAVSPAELSNPECYATTQPQSGSDRFLVRPTDFPHRQTNDWDNTVWELIKSGADKEAIYPGLNPPEQFPGGYSAIMGLNEACKLGKHHTARICLERGSDMACPNWDGDYPLHIAARNGQHETVRVLLNWGANIEARNPFLETPLHLAAMNGHDQTVQVLLSFSANTKARDNCGYFPLYVAAGHGQLRAVMTLVEAGADMVDGRDPNDVPLNHTASNSLHIAATNGHKEVVRFLLQSGADKELRTRIGRTPVHCAASHGMYWTALELMEHGADIEAKCAHGNRPLHLSAGGGKLDIMRLLLSSGADIEAKNNSGDRPLHAAAWNENHEAVKVLLLNGADIEAKNNLGDRPLHVAVDGNKKLNVEMLLSWRANRNAENSYGRTPWGIALDCPDGEMQQLLQDV